MCVNKYYMKYKDDIKMAIENNSTYYYMKVADSIRSVLEKNNIIGKDQMKFSLDDLKNILKIFGGHLFFTTDETKRFSYFEKVSNQEFNVHINTLTPYKTSTAFRALGIAIFKFNEIEIGSLLRISPLDICSTAFLASFGLGIDVFVDTLLMPKDIFIKRLIEHMDSKGNYFAEPVAEDFGVSTFKVLCRYKNLYGRND